MDLTPSSTCHVCASHGLVPVPEYGGLRRVTSDCKLWTRGGALAVCPRCGCAQALVDERWSHDASDIYRNYTLYHQGDGAEQNVFDQLAGQPIARSTRLLQRWRARMPWPPHGRLLDVGCGNGALLRAFSAMTSGWTMVGVDIESQARAAVEAIPGVECMLTCPAEQAPGRFQIVTLVHALEHIPGPATYLANLVPKIDDGGLLFVQVPDCEQNPFAFLMADHCSHFSPSTLTHAVRQAGYDIVVCATDWVDKEISVIARPATRVNAQMPDIVADSESVAARIRWLAQLVPLVQSLADPGPLGIFGTSVAAMWLAGELGSAITFFVDEDPQRAGRTLLERPVYTPATAPPHSDVFVALPPELAARVKQRLQRAGTPLVFHTPPPLP